MPDIFSMIDASQSNDPRGGSKCQVLMGHCVSSQGCIEARMKESCFLRTDSAIAPPSINHRSMTGTRSVSHAFDSSNLRFVTNHQLSCLLSKAGATSSFL